MRVVVRQGFYCTELCNVTNECVVFTILNYCVMSQMCVCGFYCTKPMCNVTNQYVVFTLVTYYLFAQVKTLALTVLKCCVQVMSQINALF